MTIYTYLMFKSIHSFDYCLKLFTMTIDFQFFFADLGVMSIRDR